MYGKIVVSNNRLKIAVLPKVFKLVILGRITLAGM
jgi:hypothetical protein